VFGSYSVTDNATVSLSLKYIETPHTENITASFKGDSIYVKSKISNMGYEWVQSGVKK